MENLKETKVASKLVFDGCLLKVYKDTVVLPNGKEATREWIKHPGASAVVPVLSDGRIVLVKQYRYPMEKVTLEIPAGKLDSNEPPEVCALRELKEETGYDAASLKKLTSIATTVGFSNEWIHLYVADQLDAGEQCTDEDEFINTVLVQPEEVDRLIACGEICDAKTLVALLMLKQVNTK